MLQVNIFIHTYIYYTENTKSSNLYIPENILFCFNPLPILHNLVISEHVLCELCNRFLIDKSSKYVYGGRGALQLNF